MNRRQWTAYILYGILVTALFLYLLFPAVSVEKYLRTRLEGALPGMAVTVASATLVFPPGLKLTDLVIGKNNDRSPFFEAEKITLRPSLRSLFSDSLLLRAQARAFGGDISARITLLKENGKSGPYEVTADLDALDMEQYSSLNRFPGQQIKGKLSGDIRYSGLRGVPLKGDGTMSLILRDGSLSFEADIFGFSTIDFDRVESNITIHDRTVTIEKLNLEGSQINGTLSGKITLRDALPKSMLSLRGKIDIPALDRQISVYLGGTLEKPSPRLK